VNKIALRKDIKGVLKSFSSEVENEKLRKIEHIFQQNYGKIKLELEKLNKLTIGTYKALNNEAFLDIENLFELFRVDIQIAYPKIINWEASKMQFCICLKKELIQNKYHSVSLMEPGLDKTDFVKPDLIFIPGLAFSRTGDRLGRGKGFYDQFLENFDGLKIGVCFEEQLKDEIPTEKTDQKMDMILTDQRMFKTKKD
jgi:5-formyltetrahydrofolate cyclo-ligase